jgi:metallo-beta-lactamase family protein
LKNNIQDARNTILIVGFQAEHTLGRRLVEGAERVKIFGDEYERKAEVAVIDGYSAHADRDGLLAYAGQIDRQRLKSVFVIHGEQSQSEALAQGIRDLGIADVRVPQVGDAFEIGA